MKKNFWCVLVMKALFIIAVCVPFLALSSCEVTNKEVDEAGVKWLKSSKLLVTNGIDVSHERGEVQLDFISLVSDEIHVLSEVFWLKSKIVKDEDNDILVITAIENPSIEPREGIVKVVAGSYVSQILVRQAGVPSAVSSQNVYSVPFEGGELSIQVNATGDLMPSLDPLKTDADWVKIRGVIKGERKGDFRIILSINKNEGLGRFMGVRLLVDGKEPLEAPGPCIIQNPAPFGEDVIVETEEAGMLPILMGYFDVNNLARISKLTISGEINGLDFELLKRILSLKRPMLHLRAHPSSFDLSKCEIRPGNDSPYDLYFAKTPFEEFPGAYLPGELPRVFTGASTIKEIVLPASLKYIGEDAFRFCTSLENITIPDGVEQIRHTAFLNCKSLKEIKISPNSNLKVLGGRVFDTGSELSDIYLPQSLTTIDPTAFLGCWTTGLHLKWLEPIEVKIVPVTRGSTLYVPKKGTHTAIINNAFITSTHQKFFFILHIAIVNGDFKPEA